MFEYRKASNNDIEILSSLRVSMLCDGELYNADFKETLYKNTLEYMQNGLNDNSICLWVATEDSKIIAMCCLNYFYLPPNEISLSGKSAHLGNMYTLPAYRNKGIASKLLELIVAEAKDNHCDRVILIPTEMGSPLYSKFGFQPWFGAMVFFPTK